MTNSDWSGVDVEKVSVTAPLISTSIPTSATATLKTPYRQFKITIPLVTLPSISTIRSLVPYCVITLVSMYVIVTLPMAAPAAILIQYQLMRYLSHQSKESIPESCDDMDVCGVSTIKAVVDFQDDSECSKANVTNSPELRERSASDVFEEEAVITEVSPLTQRIPSPLQGAMVETNAAIFSPTISTSTPPSPMNSITILPTMDYAFCVVDMSRSSSENFDKLAPVDDDDVDHNNDIKSPIVPNAFVLLNSVWKLWKRETSDWLYHQSNPAVCV